MEMASNSVFELGWYGFQELVCCHTNKNCVLMDQTRRND